MFEAPLGQVALDVASRTEPAAKRHAPIDWPWLVVALVLVGFWTAVGALLAAVV